MPIHTDPALSARRRALKPLLSAVLTGEPWTVALTDPAAVPPAVLAACAVSYISRRHARWEGIPAAALGRVLGLAIRRDRATIRPGDWPFLDALERLVPAARWQDLEPLLEPYREIAGADKKRAAGSSAACRIEGKAALMRRLEDRHLQSCPAR